MPIHNALVALLERTMAGSRAEQGCLIYRFTADLNDRDLFHLIELWETEADLMAHARGSSFGAFIAEVGALATFRSSVTREGNLSPYTFVRPTA